MNFNNKEKKSLVVSCNTQYITCVILLAPNTLTFMFNTYLLIFLYFLLGSYDAELISLLVGLPEIVLGCPQVENPNAVHTHKQHCVRHQLRRKPEKRRLLIVLSSTVIPLD